MVIVMADIIQELRKNRVRNNQELRTPETRNSNATGNATATQQNTVKDSALAVLQRNKERNSNATGKKEVRNNSRNNHSKVAHKVAHDADQRMHVMATDFARFCLSHQNTFSDGHCPVKNDKRDPITNCIGWQVKNGKVVIQ